jgi:uncharacterized RDD family membrane protein YckC
VVVREVTQASLLRRFLALMIDWALCVLVSALFADPRRSGWPPLVVLILEYGIFIGLFGQTTGMWITKIACVRRDGGGLIGVPRALVRGALLCLVVPALIMDSEGRGWHDRVAGSIMLDAQGMKSASAAGPLDQDAGGRQ